MVEYFLTHFYQISWVDFFFGLFVGIAIGRYLFKTTPIFDRLSYTCPLSKGYPPYKVELMTKNAKPTLLNCRHIKGKICQKNGEICPLFYTP